MKGQLFAMSDNTRVADVITHIRTNYDSMSKSQQKVAEFLLTHGIDVVHLSAARIAELVEVNRSTVIRTAQALGYEGFPDLQSALQEQLLGRINTVDRFQMGAQQLIDEIAEQPTSGDESSVLHSVIRAEIKNMNSILQRIPIADFEQAVEMLNDARRVYVMGARNSYPMALNFGMQLRFVVNNCQVLEPGTNTLADQMEQITSDDVLFTISYARYAEETLKAMDYALSMSTSIITLTDSTLSPAARRAGLVLLAPFRLWSYGNAASSFALLNAIFSALFLLNSNAAQKRLKRMEAIYEHFQLFASEHS